MKVPCTVCGKEVNTKKGNVYMTVRWRLQEILDMNEIEVDKELGRVAGVCSKCWSNKIKQKLDIEDYYWKYNKEV